MEVRDNERSKDGRVLQDALGQGDVKSRDRVASFDSANPEEFDSRVRLELAEFALILIWLKQQRQSQLIFAYLETKRCLCEALVRKPQSLAQ